VDRIQGRRGDRLRLAYRSTLAEQGSTIVYAHISKINIEAPTGPQVLRGQAVPRLQGQRRGGSTPWVEKEDMLAKRWARVDQVTERSASRASSVDVRQAQPWRTASTPNAVLARERGRRPDQVNALGAR
jgi:hypothetical protein